MKNYSGNIDFFARKLTNELSLKENQDFSLWLEASEQHLQEFAEFEKIWTEVDIIQGKTEFNVDAAWNKFSKEVTKPAIQWKQTLMSIAAVVTISLCSWFGYQIFAKKTIQSQVVSTAYAQVEQVKLPDNSKIALNQKSSISYPENFDNSNERRVVLHGEAFFEVTKNPEKPFVIEVNETRVKVLGTSFLITEDSIAKTVTVIVKTGKVAVYKEGATDTVYLIPGEKTVVSKTIVKTQKEKNSQINYLSWKTKELMFENTPLQDVVSEINKAYYSNIIIVNENLKKCEISISLKNKSLDEIVEILQMTLDITVEKTKNQVLISGNGC